MQTGEKYQGEGVVEGGTLLEAGFSRVDYSLAPRQGFEELVPCLAAERVESEEGG